MYMYVSNIPDVSRLKWQTISNEILFESIQYHCILAYPRYPVFWKKVGWLLWPITLYNLPIYR